MKGIPEIPKYPGLGHLQQVPNVDARFGSASHYHRVLVKCEDGNLRTLLLTDTDLARLQKRAENSPEETVDPSFWDRMR